MASEQPSTSGSEPAADDLPEAHGHHAWYTSLSDNQRQNLLQELIKLDDKHKLDHTKPKVVQLKSDMEQIMHSIARDMEKVCPLWKGTVIPCGSMSNRLKIGKLDEFDFAFEWDLKPESRDATIVYATFGYSEGFGVSPTAFTEPNNLKVSIKLQGEHDDYDAHSIHKNFHSLVNMSLKMIDLPTNWMHGGYARPRCGGVNTYGPTSVMQVVYKDPTSGEDLEITVDFVLVINIGHIQQIDINEMLDQGLHETWSKCLLDCLKKNDCYNNIWVKAAGTFSWILDNSFATSSYLKTFDEESVVKKCVRLCKILSNEVYSHPTASDLIPHMFEDETKVHHTYNQKKMRRFKEADPPREELPILSVLSDGWKARRWYEVVADQGNHYRDVGEQISPSPYIRSHTFQSLVLTFHACFLVGLVEENISAYLIEVLDFITQVLCDRLAGKRGHPLMWRVKGTEHALEVPESFTESSRFSYKYSTILKHVQLMSNMLKSLIKNHD